MQKHKTKDPQSTKAKLLDAAEKLMLAKGFVATTVDEICEGAGVTKGSFFHHFESKDALGKAAVERFSAGRESAFGEVCSRIEDPLDRVLAFVDAAVQMSKEPGAKGCLVGTFAQEVSTTHPELRQACAKSFGRFVEAIARDLREAKALHAPKAAVEPEELAEYLLALAQGSLLLMKAKRDRTVVERNLALFRCQLLELFGR
jgi:TetR/AcrR family transcriptional repressor of nem operon